MTYLPRLTSEYCYKKSLQDKHVHELWLPTCKQHTVWWRQSKNWRHGNDGTTFQHHCRFCFASITVAVWIFWDSVNFLFIAPHASGLAFLSCQVKLAIVSSTAGFLESCTFLFACLEVWRRAQELHWCLEEFVASPAGDMTGWVSRAVSRLNYLLAVAFALLLLWHCLKWHYVPCLKKRVLSSRGLRQARHFPRIKFKFREKKEESVQAAWLFTNRMGCNLSKCRSAQLCQNQWSYAALQQLRILSLYFAF